MTLARFTGGVLLSLWLLPASSQSTPQVFNFEGRVQSDSGPMNGPVTMSFDLYDASTAGTLIASLGPVAVTLSDGAYKVELPFGTAAFSGPDRYIEITVNGDVLGPRVQVDSAPFAFNADKLDGADGNEFVRKDGDAMSNLNVDGKLGVGTRSPRRSLDVRGGVAFQGNHFYLANPLAPPQKRNFGFVVSTATGTLSIGRANDVLPTGGSLETSIVRISPSAPSNSLFIESSGYVKFGKGLKFADGTKLDPDTIRGPQGPAGARGPAGPAGPAVTSFAVCVSVGVGDCVSRSCSCSPGKLESREDGPCTVTSDTGSCSANVLSCGYPVPYQVRGQCCVCKPT